MACSVIIPFYNEEENVAALLEEVASVFPSLPPGSEVIAVDDGSTDGTFDRLTGSKTPGVPLRIIRLEKRCGQSTALYAGLQAARGDVVITLDGDGQNDPSDIPRMMERLKSCDAVFGWRKDRDDPFVKRVSSLVANRVRNGILGFDVHDTGCGLKVMKKKYLEGLFAFHGMHRFFPALLRMNGAEFAEVPVKHRPRRKGRTKYSISNRLFSTLRDLFAVRWMVRRRITFKIKEIR